MQMFHLLETGEWCTGGFKHKSSCWSVVLTVNNTWIISGSGSNFALMKLSGSLKADLAASKLEGVTCTEAIAMAPTWPPPTYTGQCVYYSEWTNRVTSAETQEMLNINQATVQETWPGSRIWKRRINTWPVCHVPASALAGSRKYANSMLIALEEKQPPPLTQEPQLINSVSDIGSEPHSVVWIGFTQKSRPGMMHLFIRWTLLQQSWNLIGQKVLNYFKSQRLWRIKSLVIISVLY